MANNTTKTYREFRKSAQARLQAANAVLTKQASFNATDPTCQGTVAIPDCGDGSNREKLNLPNNMTNYSEPDKMHNLCSVTKPNGTGQGQYMIPRNGSARDAAINSFTAPMDKLALAANSLRNTAAAVRQQAQVTPDVQMNYSDVNNDAILAKLAALGAMSLEHEEGRRTMQNILEKEAGIREAQNIIYNTQDMMNKYAEAQQNYEMNQAAAQLYAQAIQQQQNAMQKQAEAAQQNYEMNQAAAQLYAQALQQQELQKQAAYAQAQQQQYADMQKIAAASVSHQAWLNQFETDLEKQAYAQGALDGEQAAQALEAGADPSTTDVPNGISDEDILGTLQELAQSGQIDENALQALLGGVQQAGADGTVTDDEIAGLLEQAVQSGELAPEQAQAIAQAVLQASSDAGVPTEGAADPGAMAPSGPVDPGVAKTANFHMQNTADIINSVA